MTQPFNTFGKLDERPQFPQLPRTEAIKVVETYANNNWNIPKTAKQLGMGVREFMQLIVRHSTLRTMICDIKRHKNCFRPYGPKKSDL